VTAVDVVILTWNDDPVLVDAAVASAIDSELPGDVSVVVVDNASTLPYSGIADHRVRVIRAATNLGVGGGRNFGIAYGEAPLVCILDSDASLRPDCLAALVAELDRVGDVGLAAPVFVDQAPQASAGRAPGVVRKLLRATNHTDHYASSPGQGTGTAWDVDFAIGACQVFRRSAFDAVGGIDSSAQFGPEDVDFCLRLRAHGWRVRQVASATCEHPPRRAFRGLASRRGMRHSVAVVRHLWWHRTRRVVATR